MSDNIIGIGNSETQWNQAQLFMIRLDTLSGLIDESFTTDQLKVTYDLMKRVYVRLYPIAASDRNKDDFMSIIKSIDEIIKNIENNFRNGIKNNELNIKTYLFDLDKKLWELQYQLELVIPIRKNKSWTDEVGEDFEQITSITQHSI